MIRASLESRLPFDDSKRWRVSVRRTGECRNSRMTHSVRRQDLLPLRVIGQSAGPAEGCQRRALGSAADHAKRGHIALSRSRKHIRGVIFPTGYPQLVALVI